MAWGGEGGVPPTPPFIFQVQKKFNINSWEFQTLLLYNNSDYTRNVINYISKNVLESQPDKDQGGETSPSPNPG